MVLTRSWFTLPLIFSFLCILLASCSSPEGIAKDGKRWYSMHNCSSCHGPNGNDGRAPNIAKIDMRFGKFLKKLRTKSASIMPYFPESKISKQDAADIYASLQSKE